MNLKKCNLWAVLAVASALGFACGDSSGPGDDNKNLWQGSNDNTNGQSNTNNQSNANTNEQSEWNGEPLASNAKSGEWSYIPFEDTQCMNGSPAGLGVQFSPNKDSNKLLLFFAGGGACFNYSTCLAATYYGQDYDQSTFNSDIYLQAGLFDRTNQLNPFKDYHFVFVPYCTGDVHTGSRLSAVVPKADKPVNFRGRNNLRSYLKRIIPTFKGVDQIALVGVSAGGFGTLANFDIVQTAFGKDKRVVLIDDSGPAMGDAYIEPCLQTYLEDLWGLRGTFPKDCKDCPKECSTCEKKSFIETLAQFMVAKYPDRPFLFISSKEDSVIRSFWGFGENSCELLNNGALFAGNYKAQKYYEGMVDFRDRILAKTPNAGLFLIPGDRHVFLDDQSITGIKVGKTNLGQWIQKALDGSNTVENVE